MHAGRIVNHYNMAKLFGRAYVKNALGQNAVNGFRKQGIWPSEPNVFRDYVPSTMIDCPFPELPSTTTGVAVTDTPLTGGIDPFNSSTSIVTICHSFANHLQ